MTVPIPSFKVQVARSAAWSALQVGGNQAATFLIFLVLSRLLTPHDIGLVALAAVFLEATMAVIRGGLPEALIQRDQFTERHADTVFWASLASSLVLGGALFALADPIGSLFTLPELAPIIEVLALGLPISALCTTHEARLMRSFGFKALALRSLLSNLVSGAVGIWMAVAGYGVWSLVAQRLLFTVIMLICVWAALPWIPRLRFSIRDLRSLFGFGFNMMIGGLLASLNSRVYELVIGYFLGASAVGLFRIASRCLNFISQLILASLSPIALPTFSRLQHDRSAFERAYLRLAQIAGFLTVPAYLGAVAVASDLVPLAFGPQWTASGQIVQILCISALPNALTYFMWPALAAMGHPAWAARMIFFLVASGAIFAAVAAPFGIGAVAVAAVLRAYLVLPLSLALLRRLAGIDFRPLLYGIMPPLAAAIAMAGILLVMRGLLLPYMTMFHLIVVLVIAGAILYAGFLLLFARSYVGVLRNLFGLLRASSAESWPYVSTDTNQTYGHAQRKDGKP